VSFQDGVWRDRIGSRSLEWEGSDAAVAHPADINGLSARGVVERLVHVPVTLESVLRLHVAPVVADSAPVALDARTAAGGGGVGVFDDAHG